ncbi:zinc-dependent metalloprotease family protein [Halomonas denitrificans]|nr:hypothetical protein [Halomonas denitrificans]
MSALRDEIGADLVTMTTGSGAGFAGYADIPRAIQLGDSSFAAFSVNIYSNQIGQNIDAHEFGHNFGGEHNPEESPVNPGDPPGEVSYPYAFGHYSNADTGGAFTTLMTVNWPLWCGGGSPPCTQPLLFSNADIVCAQCNGFPAGIPNVRENAKAFVLTAPVIANYRDRPEIIFASSFEQ